MIKFQFNKTALGELGKQLTMRQKALPTIKSKESALRSEVKKAKDRMTELKRQLDRTMAEYDYMVQLWGEFDPSLIEVKTVEVGVQKIAGVEIPVLKDIQYTEKPYNLFSTPLWIADGMRILKELARLGVESEFYQKKMELLEKARKKTTQKVNLYEKVQIPGYQEAIRKIKRFLEDEENLSKSSQKIVKSRLEAEAAL
ncbi:MAG TPA: V-type ATP synthase subunit D [Candidatus Rikenella faecigallinarum]|uniref:V-type ATP synthase subunit D n=1 Tax=Candidatus Rikenella faecigallinarum TaxID=2838745 RepID=A0A9D1QEG4_9BACT|nr:V-type ATP synthase subunit D [Candidatus Rikenella faecigallinarum]